MDDQKQEDDPIERFDNSPVSKMLKGAFAVILPVIIVFFLLHACQNAAAQ